MKLHLEPEQEKIDEEIPRASFKFYFDLDINFCMRQLESKNIISLYYKKISPPLSAPLFSAVVMGIAALPRNRFAFMKYFLLM
ncbi:hypothetical protein TSAR_011374 [Trichomalopsis sarcophagae]|uniref:Uncharacterized protein n=1 Tax=Trichomalopsis sarcophagae TaxID=543379 RepID=A0A232EFU9_9HYME|nr:hypothetical protein TSAR_011374 [Trichomalopsis sarcophagae]